MQEPVKYCIFAGLLNLLQKMENFLMKKLNCILAVAAFFLCGVVLGGCSEDDVNALSGPENTWCRMAVKYSNESDASKTADLFVWCYYSDTVVKGTGAANGLKANINLPAGLTFVVIPVQDASSVITGLVQNAYIMKTFEKDVEINNLDGTDTAYSFKGSKAKWTALYWGKADLRKTENQSSNPPYVLQQGVSSTTLEWESIKNSFSWKRLLATYLLNNLE